MKRNNTDTVFLHNISVHGKHGVYEHEQHNEQEFIVDIDAEVDIESATKSDKLEDTVDYVWFKEVAEGVIHGTSRYLVEKIAAEIAEKILKDKRINSVTVTIKKPAVLKNGLPGVSITRSR